MRLKAEVETSDGSKVAVLDLELGRNTNWKHVATLLELLVACEEFIRELVAEGAATGAASATAGSPASQNQRAEDVSDAV